MTFKELTRPATHHFADVSAAAEPPAEDFDTDVSEYPQDLYPLLVSGGGSASSSAPHTSVQANVPAQNQQPASAPVRQAQSPIQQVHLPAQQPVYSPVQQTVTVTDEHEHVADDDLEPLAAHDGRDLDFPMVADIDDALDNAASSDEEPGVELQPETPQVEEPAPVVEERRYPSRVRDPRDQWHEKPYEPIDFRNLRSSRLTSKPAAVPDHPAEPISYTAAITGKDKAHWIPSIQDEYNSLIKNETWELYPLPAGRKAISCKWVFKHKLNAQGQIARYKSRLVARGFSQVAGVDYTETFSPVVKTQSIRMILALVAARDWDLEQMDVSTAFPYGELEEDIYMEQPEGFVDPDHPTWVCKLKKTIYGLKQSASEWYKNIDAYLKSIGFVQNPADANVYIYTKNGHMVILALYVDDAILVSDDRGLLDWVKQMLHKKYDMKDIGPLMFVLGVQLLRDRVNKTLLLHQTRYINETFKRFNLDGARPVTTPGVVGFKLTSEQCPTDDDDIQAMADVPYRYAVGCLNYIACWTRPDIQHAVSYVSQFLERPSKEHWGAVKRILRYLRGTSTYGLCYQSNVPDPDFTLMGYADADWAGDMETRKSLSAYCFLLSSAVVNWSSKKQSSVALSSTEAEYKALTDAAKEAEWEQSFLAGLHFSQPQPTTIFCDNQSTIALVGNPRFHARTKHIEIQHHYVRQSVERKLVKIEYVPTDINAADLLTKALPTAKHNFLLEQMGLVDSLRLAAGSS